MFAGKKSAQIREILISESAWEEMTCLFAPSLVLTGVGYISKHVDNELQKLINSEEKLFLSNLEPYISTDNDPQFDRLTHWINNILRNDGVIFFLLGHFDERDTEVVALGSKSALKNII